MADERLGRLVHLTLEEREQLAEDLTNAFVKADGEGDEKAMADAMADLKFLDQFEQLVEQIDEALEAESAPEEEPEAKPEEAEPEDKPEDDKPEEDSPEEKPAEEDKAEAEEKPAEDTKSEDTTEEVTVASEDIQPEATAEGEPAKEESEVLAMAASAVTSAEDLKPADNEVKALVASAHAGADVRGYKTGERFRDLEDIAVAMAELVKGSNPVDSLVASIKADFPAERDLPFGDATQTSKSIDEALFGETAIVASGGFCAPLPINYDIYGVGSTVRPIRDSLPTFGATRGGIRYIAPPVLGSYTSAISVWTAANDANPTSPATKPVLKVNCASELTASTDAITLSLEFGNLMTRAFPELVQRHNQLALIEHARIAEKTLLSKISALSTKVTTSYKQGVTRDLLGTISRAAVFYRNRHRIPRPTKLQAILPEWVRDALREDIATNFNMGAQDIAVSDALLDQWFASRGLSITWHMDDTLAAQTGGGAALNDFPATIKFWLFTQGTLLFLDGGTLDLGVVRDADLVGTNDYVTFVETFEGVAKVGIEVLEVTATTGVGLPPEPETP